jgi:hypothetical protein
VELGAPAAFAGIVWHLGRFPPLSPQASRFLSIYRAGTEAAHRVGSVLGEGNCGVVNSQPTEDASLQ